LRRRAPPEVRRTVAMLDVILSAGAVAFFAVSVAYVYACDRM
jgi:hypothetical protein